MRLPPREAPRRRDVAELGGVAGIREMVTLAHRSVDEPDLIKFFAVLLAENFETDAPAHDFFVEHYRALRVSVVELIESGQRRGELRADVDPALKAVEILGALDGMASQWLLDPEAIDFVACLEAYVETLERDLAVAP